MRVPSALLLLSLALAAPACRRAARAPEAAPDARPRPATGGLSPRTGPPLAVTARRAEDGSLAILAGGEPFGVLRWRGLAKPCLAPLVAPGGRVVTRRFPFGDAPGEAHDHPHHTGAFLAHGDANGADLWSGRDGARIALDGDPEVARDGDALRVDLALRWLAGDGRAVARERRRLRFAATPSERTIDLVSHLAPAGDALVLGDTKEGTFAVRLAPSLRVEGEVAAGHFLSSEGRRDREVWGTRARWVAAYGTVEGEPVTVLILDHPANPHHPTFWHARPYGLFAANPFGAHDFAGAPAGSGAVRVAAGETLVLRWRLVLLAGEPNPAACEARWRAYAHGAAEGKAKGRAGAEASGAHTER